MLVVCEIIFSATSIYAEKRFHFEIDYHYSLGLCQRVLSTNFTRKDDKMGGSAVEFGVRYDINRQVSAGIKTGYHLYTEPYYSGVPVYATVHYAPLNSVPRAFAFADAGYAIKAGQDPCAGFCGRLGIGYTLRLSKKCGLNLTAAYDLRRFRNGAVNIYYNEVEDKTYSYKIANTRHSIAFGVGVTF